MNIGGNALLEPRLVADVKGSFLVKDYQRGYRWGHDEVRRLLDDIRDAGGRDYYLQPVVVKDLGAGQWELVDGQQRLTTLYLIQHHIKQRHLPAVEVGYTLSYETRPGSARYLDNPTEAASSANIDYFHIYQALRSIETWFAEQSNEALAAIDFYRALASSVRVIWYEAPDTLEFDSRTLFTRLNVGRIPLTDAELVKARLLSRIEHQHETAAMWDSIERDLQAPEVWAFATAKADSGPTRISLLLDTLADLTTGTEGGADRPLYHTFETLQPRIDAAPDGLFDEILDLHSLIQGWYDDRNLFHKIGYLIASDAATFLELVTLGQECAKTEFDAVLDQRIRASLEMSRSDVESLSYGSRKTVRTLLLMNVETVRGRTQSSERYSFDAHARRAWSLEHIHAQNSEGLNNVEQWTVWLREHVAALDALDLPAAELEAVTARVNSALATTITNETFESLHRELTELFTADQDVGDPDDPGVRDYAEVDAIANLALLARDDNSVLSNAVFEVKRRHVIELDRDGFYIPVCTRNVFLKYYTDTPSHQLHFWGPNDRQGYLNAMAEALAPYLHAEAPEEQMLVDGEDAS